MKEKIGIEKLIELLNEYDEYRGEKRRDYGWTKDKVELDVKMIIFKKFGFIKWLVDNDKIDLEKLLKVIKENKIYCGKWGKTRNMLLMLLAVSDSPVNDLISILK